MKTVVVLACVVAICNAILAPTDVCPTDECPKKGADFSGHIAHPSNTRQFIICYKGSTVGCEACPQNLEYNECEDQCIEPSK